MKIEEVRISGTMCRLYLPPDYDRGNECYPVVYVNGEIPIEEIIEEMKEAGADVGFILLSVCPKSWNDDFTPWKAPAFRKGEAAPQGRAEAYMEHLTKELKPYMDANYRTRPEPADTALIGYSLGGLAALYAIYITDRFGMVGSLSGSLWYDDFCAFVEREKPLREEQYVYLSLGKKERHSRNQRMGKVAECTEQVRSILTSRFTEEKICFEWNEGGHFHDIAGRFAGALLWWRQTMQECMCRP